MSALPLAALLSLFPTKTLDISKYTKVYRGEEGLEVAFVALRSNAGALIRVSGVDTEIDGVVLRYEKHPQSRGSFRYSTTLHGEGFGTFHTRKKRGSNEKRVFIFLPETPMEKLVVTYDETRSKAVSSDSILDAYLAAKNQAKLKKLARWNRAERIARQNRWLQEEADLMSKKCGHKIKVKIDWKTVTDDILKVYSIHGYCSTPLEAMRHICDESKEYKGYIQKKISNVRCRFGDKLHLELGDNKTLLFSTDVKASNQADFVKSYLKNTL